MRSSLKKLRGFSLHHRHRHHGRRDPKDERDDGVEPLAQLDEIAKAARDMQDMRDCYDNLLSAAAATANSAYEFSESIRDLGECLLEKTAMNYDEDTGQVLTMLGKAQVRLHTLVDNYRSHIFKTITAPSESLLNELHNVEEMKRQCEAKRDVYEHMVTSKRENDRAKSSKEEVISMQQLQEAHDEYDEEATLFVFRLKSLKQGQSRSLLTQAARHHAAQLQFMRKAVKTLEAVDPFVKSVTEQHHIDYYFPGPDDDGDSGVSENDDNSSNDARDDGELSSDYGQTDQDHGVLSPSLYTMEEKFHRIHKYHGKKKSGSQSAPLLAEKVLEPAEKMKQLRQSSSRKFHAYVLPTPTDTKGSASSPSANPIPAEQTSINWHTKNSSSLEMKKDLNISGDEKSYRFSSPSLELVLKESNHNTSGRLPPPLVKGLLFTHDESHTASELKKHRRHTFSDPLTSKQSNNAPPALLLSGPFVRNPVLQTLGSSSPHDSPTLVSSPKISELHELPRPPTDSTPKSARSLPSISHSAPLSSRGKEFSFTQRIEKSSSMSPLPTPQQTISRSFSIPSRDPTDSKLLASSTITEISEDVASPPQH